MKNVKYIHLAKFYLCIVSFLLTIISCKSTDETLSIIPFQMQNSVDSIMNGNDVVIDKFDYFLVQNYSSNNIVAEDIRHYAELNKAADYKKFTHYKMLFYKNSNRTNIKNINRNPKIADRYVMEDDLIYQLEWQNGIFFKMTKFVNGQSEDLHDVKIENIPTDN